MRRATKLATVAVAVASVAGIAPTVGFTHSPPSAQTTAAPAVTTFPQLRFGATGPRVVQVQTALRSLGYTIAADGVFGPRTLASVRAFQAARGLRVDGIVGPLTWAALGLNGGTTPTTPPAFQSVSLGSTGPRVTQVQTALRSLGYTIATDGVFGPRTLASVRAFQTSRGLRVDGIVGPVTWAALGLNGTTPAAPVTPATPATPTAPATGGYVHPNANVERWHAAALAAGWPESDWRRLSCIIQRESNGIPTAKNPNSSAMGLLQIMWSVHASWIGGSSSQLFDGPTNLRLGRQLYTRAGGWSPWNSTVNGC